MKWFAMLALLMLTGPALAGEADKGITVDDDGTTHYPNGTYRDPDGGWHFEPDKATECHCHLETDGDGGLHIVWDKGAFPDDGGDAGDQSGLGGMNAESGHGTDGSNDRAK